MKKKVHWFVVGLSLILSLLFTNSASLKSEELISQSPRSEMRLPETKTKIKVVTKSKPKVVAKSKAKVVAKPKTKTIAKNQITFSGKTIPLVNSQGAKAAPNGNKAGYWRGNGKVDDNQTTHIIGHNPGAFASAFQLKNGSIIKMADANGKVRNYKVYAILTVNDNVYGRNGKDYWSTIFNQKGESISLQTCINDYWNLIILAK